MKTIDIQLRERIMGRKAIEDYFATRCQKDTEFRKQFFENPKRIIEEEMEISIPCCISTVICEETSRHFFLVIPLKADDSLSADKLTDEDLDSVMGGQQVFNHHNFIHLMVNKLIKENSTGEDKHHG